MSFIVAIVLGILEGLTEFLPVSSTGHLILAEHALQIPDSDALKSFTIAVQLGAIFAVIILYWRSFLNLEVMKRIVAAFFPTMIVGFALYSFFKKYLLGNELVVLISLLVGGIVLITFDRLHKEKPVSEAKGRIEDISYKEAISLGLIQSLAIVPGVSRSGATIIGGLLLGLKKVAIVEFSFLLAVPTLLAATAYDLLKSYSTFETADFSAIIIGSIAAFIVAVLAIKFFLKYVRTHSFMLFGFYRIFIAIIFWLVFVR